MAGNAVGLGNFLRFPRQVVANGGGTFMIPYFLAFVLLGIPLMWIEWAIGRRGGQEGHGSLPGQLSVLWKHPLAKYLGAFGLFIPLLVLVYYCVVESWTLAYTVYALTGHYRGLGETGMRLFLATYQEPLATGHVAWAPFLFFGLTLALNFWVLKRGLSGGIETLARYGLPLLFVFAAILVVRVLTLGAHVSSPWAGLDFMYTPDLHALARPAVWLAAAGQIFFTLSVGTGAVSAYASYVGRNDDIALAGLAAAATNETAEVVLGGALAIPAVVTFFGVSAAVAIAHGGSFDLGFVSMPLVFARLPGGAVVAAGAGFLWFGLLFLAGITSSVAMANPMLSFLEENFGWRRSKSIALVATFALLLGVVHIVWYRLGFLEEWDYWVGTFALVVCALVETAIFVWVLGPAEAWAEINRGAQMRIPAFMRTVITWITPLFLIVLMVWWTVNDAIPTLLMRGMPANQHAVRWISRGAMMTTIVALLLAIRFAWRRRSAQGGTA